MPEILYDIKSMAELKRLLAENPGRLILKFGAEWCAPCEKIKDLVEEYFVSMPDHVQCVVLDVDESFEVYAQLKNRKILGGIPAMLMYKQSNEDPSAYDDSVKGANVDEIKAFFARCLRD